jgi:hypothetical protein
VEVSRCPVRARGIQKRNSANSGVAIEEQRVGSTTVLLIACKPVGLEWPWAGEAEGVERP